MFNTPPGRLSPRRRRRCSPAGRPGCLNEAHITMSRVLCSDLITTFIGFATVVITWTDIIGDCLKCKLSMKFCFFYFVFLFHGATCRCDTDTQTRIGAGKVHSVSRPGPSNKLIRFYKGFELENDRKKTHVVLQHLHDYVYWLKSVSSLRHVINKTKRELVHLSYQNKDTNYSHDFVVDK